MFASISLYGVILNSDVFSHFVANDLGGGDIGNVQAAALDVRHGVGAGDYYCVGGQVIDNMVVFHSEAIVESIMPINTNASTLNTGVSI